MRLFIILAILGGSLTVSAQTSFSSLEVTGVNPISSTNGFNNVFQLKKSDHAAIVFQPGTTQELMFGFHSNGNFYWGSGMNAGNYYPMVLSNTGDLTIGKYLEVNGNASVKQTLRLNSNGTHSSEVLFYKQSGDYYSIFGNTSGFGIYNSTTDSKVLEVTSDNEIGMGCSGVAGYRLAVAGHMITESIKVKLQSSWPDDVFTSAHKLPPLPDIEKFIQQNQHLPEIPSAEEVRENGLDLGEINAKLLKKIEELTLYIIDQNKAIKESSLRSDKMEARISQQQNEIGLLRKIVEADVAD